MVNASMSPVDILCRELQRLDNDMDRLQMLVTLKSHLTNLQFSLPALQKFLSLFRNERVRLQVIYQLLPFILTSITSESLKMLLDFLDDNEDRLKLIETLQDYTSLKSNATINEILRGEYRRYFLVNKTRSKQNIEHSQNQSVRNCSKEMSPIPSTIASKDDGLSESSMSLKISSNTSGVFEKAKQFVSRVFRGGSSSTFYASSSLLSESLPSKRLINEFNSETANTKRKRIDLTEDDSMFYPTAIPLSTSQSFTSVLIPSPPPSPTTIVHQLITHQPSISSRLGESSSPPRESTMVTKIHSILDNIDSVLDKIEIQVNTVTRHPNPNEDLVSNEASNTLYSSVESYAELPSTAAQQSIDQITQTTIDVVERHVNMNDGSGDTTPIFIDLLNIVEESHSMMSLESSDEVIHNFN